jgi:hypothetical protein
MRNKLMVKGSTHLCLNIAALIVAIRSSTKRGTGGIAATDTTALSQVLLPLRLPNLDLLLLTPSTQLIWLESAFSLEGRAAMFGDVSLSHA